MTFEFDPDKSASNKIKHGLDFFEVQELWNSERVEISVKTISEEPRFAVIGIINDRFYTVIVTYRGSSIRLISARPSRTNEKKLYENS